MSDNGKIITLPIGDIIPDPLNEEAFDVGDISSLMENIKNEGFIGDIAAYPVDDGKYMIESGHRRYMAAVMSGYKEIPVRVTEAPLDIEERRRRLVRWNLHNRPADPMSLAKLSRFLFDTYEMQNKRLKDMGMDTEPVLERIASDLECSKSNVSKLRMLLSLTPELQELVKSGSVSWASLSAAAALSESQQDMLYKRICAQKRIGVEVTGRWLDREIKEFRYVKTDRTVRSGISSGKRSYSFDVYREKASGDRDDACGVDKKKRRRKDGMKALIKARDYITSALSDESFIYDCDMGKASEVLGDISDTVKYALDRYEESGRFK